MNVYDEAHNLAKAIKESGEYKDYMRLRQQTDGDPQLKDMLKQLQDMQVTIQTAQLTGQTPDPQAMQQFQSLYTMLMANPAAAEYMQAELRISMMIKDVFEILGDAVDFVR